MNLDKSVSASPGMSRVVIVYDRLGTLDERRSLASWKGHGIERECRLHWNHDLSTYGFETWSKFEILTTFSCLRNWSWVTIRVSTVLSLQLMAGGLIQVRRTISFSLWCCQVSSSSNSTKTAPFLLFWTHPPIHPCVLFFFENYQDSSTNGVDFSEQFFSRLVRYVNPALLKDQIDDSTYVFINLGYSFQDIYSLGCFFDGDISVHTLNVVMFEVHLHCRFEAVRTSSVWKLFLPFFPSSVSSHNHNFHWINAKWNVYSLFNSCKLLKKCLCNISFSSTAQLAR